MVVQAVKIDSKKDKKTEATRTALMLAAERLIAQKGLANVSAREILQEAGQKNQSALQYHFGSKDDLILSTICHRIAQCDARRQELIAEWPDKPGYGDIITAIFLPLAELAELDEHGKNYVIFTCQAMTQPYWSIRQAIEDFDMKALEYTYSRYDQMLSYMSDKERLLRQAIIYDMAILTLRRWCEQPAPKRTSREILDVIIKVTKTLIGC